MLNRRFRSAPGFPLGLPRLKSSFPLGVFALLGAMTTMACIQASRNAQAAVLRCEDLGSLISAFRNKHYSIRHLSEEVQHRAVEQFLRGLDPSRTLLLRDEVIRLEKELTKTFGGLRRGECSSLDKAFALIRERAEEDTARAKALLGHKDFSIDTSIRLVIDPEERGYPKSSKERDTLGTALIHFQMANYSNQGISLEKAKSRLIHRYELTEKRLAERAKEKRLPELFASAFARSLDPHSEYMSQEDFDDFRILMGLSLEGIGARLRIEDGYTYIESLIPGGGGEKSGKLKPKDKIIAVAQDGEEEAIPTVDMAIRDVVKLIRGPKGTMVTLTILREGKETKTFDVTIVRDKIDVAQQAAKLEIQTRELGSRKVRVGVLELPSFYGQGTNNDGRSSYEDVRRLLAEARQEKAEALVLDLSKNGGGYLEDAVRISGLFIREGSIVATRDTDGDVSILRDNNDSTEWSGPLVVLVSPISASASEILAGSLQAYRRAVVVGASESSFGKGSVQTVHRLPPRLGAMRVTTGMYFLPDGRSTQRTGVEADIIVPSLLSNIDIGEKDLDYSLPAQSTRPFLSKRVNDRGDFRWKPVSPIRVARLREASRARVQEVQIFRQIEKEAKKAADRSTAVVLAELLTKKGEKETEQEEVDEKRYEKMEQAFVDEAVSIAVDLAAEADPRAGNSPSRSKPPVITKSRNDRVSAGGPPED